MSPSRAAAPRGEGRLGTEARGREADGLTPGARCNSAWRPSGCSTACCSTSRSCTPRGSARCSRGPPPATRPSSPARSPGTPPSSTHHLVLLNTIFATIQLLLGLGIAFRPTVRLALAASIAWSLGVWWFGEGLGGVLSGTASPLNGAPGAVILYALLAVLLWPADRETAAPFTAARAVGAPVARALWLVLWLSLAYFALTPGEPGPAGAQRHDRGHGERRARLAAGRERGAAVAGRQPGAGRLGRAGGGARADRRRGLPAGRGRQGDPGARHRGGRCDLGRRRGVRRRFSPAAGPTPTPGRCSSCSPWPTGRAYRPAAAEARLPARTREKGRRPDDPRLDPGHFRRRSCSWSRRSARPGWWRRGRGSAARSSSTPTWRTC